MTLPVYYAEINTITILIMHLLLRQIRNRDSGEKLDVIMMKHIIYCEIIYSISDFVAAYFRGKLFIGARAAIEVSNLIYMIAGLGICYFWLMYVFIKIDEANYTVKRRIVYSIPYLLGTISCFFNPYTNFYFSINNQNLYQREAGSNLFWGLLLCYGVYAASLCVYAMAKTNNPVKRSMYYSTFLFALPAAVGCIIQFSFYGITCTQVGVMISLLLIFLDSEANMVLKDELTGFNNKRALRQYIYYLLDRNDSVKITIIRIRIKNIKEINDLKGRIEGDRALKTAGRVISMSLNKSVKRIALYRFGSGEFLIVNPDMTLTDVATIRNQIYEGFDKFNQTSYQDYNLAINIDSIQDDIYSEKDFNNLVTKMYKSSANEQE